MKVCTMMLIVLCFVLMCGHSLAQNDVEVIRMQLPFEVEHVLSMNGSIEYILEFIPNFEQRQYPSQINVKTDGGDTSQPILITARQGVGISTWQLPYRSGSQVLYEVSRTLCPEHLIDTANNTECGEQSSFRVKNTFILQISSTCATQQELTLLAAPARDFALPFQTNTEILATFTKPTVQHYAFRDGQSSVRLTLQSDHRAVCAMLSLQNVTCPVLQTSALLPQAGWRLTMLRSAAVHVPRHRFPNGFYLVVVLLPSSRECFGEAGPDDDWLWEDMFGGPGRQPTRGGREKSITVYVQASITLSQYALATGLTLLFCGIFYIAFFALVFAQKWPRFAKYVSPKARLVDDEHRNGVDVPDGVPSTGRSRRRRRLSTATFDSSEDSNSSDEEQEAGTASTVVDRRPANDQPSGTQDTAGESGDQRPGHNGQVDEANGRSARNGQAYDVDGRPVQNGQANETQISPEDPDSLVLASDVNELHPPTFLHAEGAFSHPCVVALFYSLPTSNTGCSFQPSTTPYGLPPSLRLAALSRRRGRTLQARSDRYLHTLYIVAVFYALPVLQFVSAFQIFFNYSGSLDLCYYNFLCSHAAGALSDFSHVFSNLAYLLLGALFMLQLRRRRARRVRSPRSEEYGIPAHYGMLSALGAGMMAVGLLSAGYHVCPNRLNFQFDTAFMYVLAVVSMVKIYQSRHPDVNARAHATFGVLAVMIALVVWGVLGGGAFFWALFTVLHLFTFLLLSLRIYYVGQFRLERETLQRAARELAAMPRRGVRPLYKTRLVLLLIANSVNWLLALYGLWKQSADIASHLLELLLINTLLYMSFYLVMKLLNGERPRWYAWCYLGGATVAWIPALYFFVYGSTDWSTTPALSREMNHQCMVLEFYDAHDLWHILSAVALFLSFNVLLTWDDGLAAVKRTEIAVF
ncbi:SID1 transmembrane family member 2 [Plutella xylostella]|nr:SID1 transmembrane family member 2 [Plutella xylostella]